MGRAYSQDLRLRVLEAIDGGMNKMQAHKMFRVSRSTIDDWLRLRAEQGHVQVKPPRHTKAGGALGDTELFGAFAARHSGATLKRRDLEADGSRLAAGKRTRQRVKHQYLFSGSETLGMDA